eukprot:scaffold86101_cov15-Tisochrysis_lutea.AAC.1
MRCAQPTSSCCVLGWTQPVAQCPRPQTSTNWTLSPPPKPQTHPPVVRAHFKVLPGILVHVWGPQHAVNFLAGGQHDWALELRAGHVRDGGHVSHRVRQQVGIVGTHANAQAHWMVGWRGEVRKG